MKHRAARAASAVLSLWALSVAASIARRLRSAGIDALADEALVESASRPRELSSWLVRAGLDPASIKVRQRYGHFYVTLQAIINEYGSCIGSLQVLQDELAAGRIEAPFPKLTTPGVEYRLIQSPAVEHLLAEKFIAWLLLADTRSSAT